MHGKDSALVRARRSVMVRRSVIKHVMAIIDKSSTQSNLSYADP